MLVHPDVPAQGVPALSPDWEAAIPDSILDDVADTEDVPALRDAGTREWRIEVTRRGKYWLWRRGRAKNRQSRYGGKFELLSPERQAAYEQNKAKRTSTGRLTHTRR